MLLIVPSVSQAADGFSASPVGVYFTLVDWNWVAAARFSTLAMSFTMRRWFKFLRSNLLIRIRYSVYGIALP